MDRSKINRAEAASDRARRSAEESVMSIIPCHRGGHNCNWPACPQDCDGRPAADAYSAALDKLDDGQCADCPGDIDENWVWVGTLRRNVR